MGDQRRVHDDPLYADCKAAETGGDYEQMLALAKRLVARFSAESNAYLVLAWAYCRLERFDEALEAAGRAIQLYPGNLDAWLCLGGAYVHQREWGSALSAATVAFDISPGEPLVYELMADAYDGLGEHELAARGRSLAVQIRSVPRSMWRVIDSGSWRIERKRKFRQHTQQLLDLYSP